MTCYGWHPPLSEREYRIWQDIQKLNYGIVRREAMRLHNPDAIDSVQKGIDRLVRQRDSLQHAMDKIYSERDNNKLIDKLEVL